MSIATANAAHVHSPLLNQPSAQPAIQPCKHHSAHLCLTWALSCQCSRVKATSSARSSTLKPRVLPAKPRRRLPLCNPSQTQPTQLLWPPCRRHSDSRFASLVSNYHRFQSKANQLLKLRHDLQRTASRKSWPNISVPLLDWIRSLALGAARQKSPIAPAK